MSEAGQTERDLASAALPFARIGKINVKPAKGENPATVTITFETLMGPDWNKARVLLDDLARLGAGCKPLIIESEPTFAEMQVRLDAAAKA